MKRILNLIAEKTILHSQLPFYQFLRNTSISPQGRMAFAPCFTFFVMNFSELNRHVLREEPTADPIQALINEHTYEDEAHWIWFLEDLQKLGYEGNLPFTEAMRFLWSDETMVQRRVVRWMFKEATLAKPIHRLVLVEAIEHIAGIFLPTTKLVTEQFQTSELQTCRYFGSLHSLSDSGHEMHSKEMEDFIGNMPLTDGEYTEAVRLVEETFDVFADLVSDLLAHAKVPKVVNRNFLYTYELRSQHVHKIKPIGAYLVEAGLLTAERLDLALSEQRTTNKRLGDLVSSHGWVSQQTIEYFVEKLVQPERQKLLSIEESPKQLVAF
jgi:uncharacterized protein (DUF427 family)